MSTVGYYRYKLDNLNEGTHQISLYKNGEVAVTHTVIVKGWESAQKIVKYIDKNGQYRFYPFNCRWETRDKPKLIGKAGRLITSILEGQSNQKNIGYKNIRTISLVADAVSDTELEFLQDIWNSPRVYLHIGTNNQDEAKHWLEVTVTGGDNTAKRRKLENGKLTLDIELPEWFNISMI
jgi:hypothetical protein